MKKHVNLFTLFLMFVSYILCEGQKKTELLTGSVKSETEAVITSLGPITITRDIKQDRNGNIWLATFQGIFRYDGKSYRNYIIKEDSLIEDRTGISFSNSARPPNEVTSIIEDKTGKFWFGTRGNAFVYDGKTFTTLTHNGKTFRNVRSIIEDKKGNIWLGSQFGLWRYDGSTFTNITQNAVPVVYEDRNGNIWTGSQPRDWVLSRYDEKSLSNNKPTVTELESEYADNMIFRILEANDGSIWFGTLLGAYRYDGSAIRNLKDQECQ